MNPVQNFIGNDFPLPLSPSKTASLAKFLRKAAEDMLKKKHCCGDSSTEAQVQGSKLITAAESFL